ncbi:unnamed protein product [Sphagnum tenellum]
MPERREGLLPCLPASLPAVLAACLPAFGPGGQPIRAARAETGLNGFKPAWRGRIPLPCRQHQLRVTGLVSETKSLREVME